MREWWISILSMFVVLVGALLETMLAFALIAVMLWPVWIVAGIGWAVYTE